MLQKWNAIGLLMFACTLSACRPHPNANVNTALTVAHQEAMKHLAMGLWLKNRGVGAGPNVPRATQVDLEKAVTEFQTVLRVEPDNHAASFDLTDCLIRVGKTEEAIPILQTLAKNKDDYAGFAQKKLAKMGVPLTK